MSVVNKASLTGISVAKSQGKKRDWWAVTWDATLIGSQRRQSSCPGEKLLKEYQRAESPRTVRRWPGDGSLEEQHVFTQDPFICAGASPGSLQRICAACIPASCIPYDVSLNLAKVMEFQPILEAFCCCQHFTMVSSSRPVLSLGPLFSDCLSVLPPWLDWVAHLVDPKHSPCSRGNKNSLFWA